MRNRSIAIVIRDGSILMELTKDPKGRLYYSVPGGGIESGETPEEAVIRELKEECGLDGVIRKPLNFIHTRDGNLEYVYQVDVPVDQEAITGYDPDVPVDKQTIVGVVWKKLHELDEKDRAFLWSYGLMQVDQYLEEVLSWGNAISYPKEIQ